MGSYLPSTPAEREDMLAAIGCESVDELYRNVPQGVRCGTLDIPGGKSEMEVLGELTRMADNNTVLKSVFRGAGAYKRYIPSLVKTVTANEAFLTAYTPYQAEISQGVLQSIFEYQTMVCELTGMDVSNASLYDGASAAAEAVLMCGERKRMSVVVSGALHPETLETVLTYCAAHDVEVTLVPVVDGVTRPEDFAAAIDETTACALFQQPNFFGLLEDASALIEATHAAGAKSVMAVDPISLGLLATPGELGADVCVAEGQSLGLPLSFGGPYLGIIACKKALMRKLPGRIVGQTHDSAGNRAFVLTLQAREQHIRREKASSNICSNQALCALAAGVYLSCMGPHGIRQVASLSLSKAHYLAEQVCQVEGFARVFAGEFFNEFLTTCPIDPEELEERMAAHGILCGMPVGDKMLWCATEVNTKEEIDAMVRTLKEVL